MADRPQKRSVGDNAVHERLLPLDTARECFAVLVSEPEPLSLECSDFSGLPNRSVPLDELRTRLLRGSCPRSTRDAVWAALVRRSRSEGATWTLACAGMALPALARVSGWLAARYPDDPFDVHAEVLSGFLGALVVIDLERPRVLVRLKWAAYRQGFAALAEALDAPTPVAPGFRSAPPRPPWGHPDLVLARAVRTGVLSRTEADLIGCTRLDDESVTDWATAHGMTVQAVYKARRRAEYRLVDFLRDRMQTAGPEVPVAGVAVADLVAVPVRSVRRGPAQASLPVIGTPAGAPPRAGEKNSAAMSKGAA